LKERDQETSSERAKEGVADWGPRQHHGHGAVGLASPVWTVDSHAHHPNKTGRASKGSKNTGARCRNSFAKQAESAYDGRDRSAQKT